MSRHRLFRGVLVVLSAVVIVWTAPLLQAQTFSVLHDFTAGLEGAQPWGGLTMDQRGNLYGTTIYAGANNQGTVFELARAGSGWTMHPLYSFSGTNDGIFPEAPLTIGPDGSLYGSTLYGGSANNGTVFNLRPPSNPCKSVLCFWSETILHSFTAEPDGSDPGYGAVIFDQAGNLYDTTTYGGANNLGTVYELTRSGGTWTESIISNLTPTATGIQPYGGLILDSAGHLYGTASSAGGGNGTVFELGRTSTGWVTNILYTFPQGQQNTAGAYPYSTLIFDSSGNLYGTTYYGGANLAGVAFQLSHSGGGWAETVLSNLTGGTGEGARVGLAMDSQGNFYGSTPMGGGFGWGLVFKISRSGDTWTYTDLHDFTGGSDGAIPFGQVIVDASGNLYGAAVQGGTNTGNCYPSGCGVVWEITP